jgi:hypothetical protein
MNLHVFVHSRQRLHRAWSGVREGLIPWGHAFRQRLQSTHFSLSTFRNSPDILLNHP